MSAPPPAPAPLPARGSRQRLAWQIVLAVFVVALGLGGWYYLRGSWASANAADPASPEAGVVSRLVVSEDGGTDIRTSVVLPVPVETAWKILSNYDEWEKLFKTVRKKQLAEPLEGNRYHVVSDVMTPLGQISLDFIVYHERTPEGGYLAWWDAPTPELPVNKGTIRLTPRGPDETLLAYNVRKQYLQYPQFLVNNMLLDQQPDLIRTLSQRMIEAAREP